MVKIKDKEALFNVAYNEIDNIYIFNRYLHALLYLPSTTPFMPASARELLVPFFATFGMVRLWDLNPQPPAPKADALPTELLRR